MDDPLTNDKKGDISLDKEMLTKAQSNFLSYCRQFGWGKLEVTVVNGIPVLSKELEHTHRHD